MNEVQPARKVPLPPLDEDRFKIDEALRERWIEAHEDAYQAPLRSLTDRIRVVSSREFCLALRASVESIEDFPKRATILVQENKSNQWVAELADKYLKICGMQVPLGENFAEKFVEDGQYLDKLDPKEWPSDVVLFDDASYSGTQMVGHISAIFYKMRTKVVKPTRIYTIVPFMTRHARGKLMDCVKLGNKNINLVASSFERMQTVHEILSENRFLHRDEIRRLYPPAVLPEEESGLTLTLFHHKMPNSMSFFGPVADATVYPPRKWEQWEMPKKFLPAIVPPYKGPRI